MISTTSRSVPPGLRLKTTWRTRGAVFAVINVSTALDCRQETYVFSGVRGPDARSTRSEVPRDSTEICLLIDRTVNQSHTIVLRTLQRHDIESHASSSKSRQP